MDLVERVRDILVRPRDAWYDIAEEQTTIRRLYVSYAMILAAVPVIAQLIGMTVVGIMFLGVRYRAPFHGALGYAIISYILSLAGLYLFALILNALAPKFGSRENLDQAMKLSVYSSTPYWIAGILLVIPALSPVVVLLSLYGFFLLYVGLPILMETPRERITVYFILILAISMVISALTGVLATLFFPQGRMGVV